MENKEEIKRIDGKYYLVRELETEWDPVRIDGEMLQPINSIDDDDCQHCCLYDTYNCGEPCVGGFLVRVLPENSKEKDEENLSNVEITGKNLKHDNKENMEERKKNLKPFDLEAAKSGKPVCTRNGRKARIICFDLEGAEYPIVAAIKPHNCDTESLSAYDEKGKYNHECESSNDLMMLPERKEGWVNVYEGGLLDVKSYKTKEEALAIASHKNYVDTVKIEWEE